MKDQNWRAVEPYLVFEGKPKEGFVWDPIRHSYYWAVRVDIGRAPRPEPTGDPDDLIRSKDGDKEMFNCREYSHVIETYQIVADYLRQKTDHVRLDVMAQDLGLSPRKVNYLINKYRERFIFKRVRGYSRRRSDGSLGRMSTFLAVQVKGVSSVQETAGRAHNEER